MIRYITHPQVLIDPEVSVGRWPLNATGRSRAEALAMSGALAGTKTVISSAETKALDTAAPIAKALGCEVSVRPLMHENDRSSTGFLPSEKFEAAADQFFANPTLSFKGWETAQAAQTRIVAEFYDAVEHADAGDVVFLGHGAVGTLLYCHLANLPIDRKHDQPLGGGSYFELADIDHPPMQGWRLIEDLIDRQDL